jgi:hypothetical protein
MMPADVLEQAREFLAGSIAFAMCIAVLLAVSGAWLGRDRAD